MIPSATLKARFDELQPILREVGERVCARLMHYCEEQGYAFAWRYKTLESLAEKIETGRFHGWSDLKDMFACTVIVPDLTREAAVESYCGSVFDIVTVTPRGTREKAPGDFRYDSTQIHARLRRAEHAEGIENPAYYAVVFEIQVKTAFEHAWSVTTHGLTYKSSVVDWRRLRLEAQMKAIVEQLDSLVLGFANHADQLPMSPWPATERLAQIAAWLEGLINDGMVPSEIAPKDVSRFCQNLDSLLRCCEGPSDITDALGTLDTALRSGGADLIPRSISLLQFCYALLVEHALVGPPSADYHLHITPEFRDLYPSACDVDLAFDYDA